MKNQITNLTQKCVFCVSTMSFFVHAWRHLNLQLNDHSSYSRWLKQPWLPGCFHFTGRKTWCFCLLSIQKELFSCTTSTTATYFHPRNRRDERKRLWQQIFLISHGNKRVDVAPPLRTWRRKSPPAQKDGRRPRRSQQGVGGLTRRVYSSFTDLSAASPSVLPISWDVRDFLGFMNTDPDAHETVGVWA